MALWFLLQTIAILVVMGVIFGGLLQFTLIGIAVGAGTAFSTRAIWKLGRDQLEQQGFRW